MPSRSADPHRALGRSDLACSSASGSRSALISISLSWRSCTRSQSRSCSEGSSSTHQKSDAGSIASVFSTLHAAGSIRSSTAHRGSLVRAPAWTVVAGVDGQLAPRHAAEFCRVTCRKICRRRLQYLPVNFHAERPVGSFEGDRDR
jgi:hypothetical protein